MKNCLDYYYGIKTNDIHRINDRYKFEIDQYQYIFFEYYGDASQANDVYNFSVELIGRGVYCHQIILNKDGKVITYDSGKSYILMRFYKDLERKIELDDILLINTVYIENDRFNRTNWKKLWEDKIDYLEYQISQFGNKHQLLRNSFNYFSGFVETSIQILNGINIKESKTVLSHKRVKESYNLFDLYNPFNFIVDFKIRDFCEYIKDKIFQKKNTSNLDELEQLTYMYISNNNLTISDVQLFFARLLYPSFYFDVFENLIISEEEDSDNAQLNEILEIIDDYEKFVTDIYNYYFNNNYLPLIEWLRKN